MTFLAEMIQAFVGTGLCVLIAGFLMQRITPATPGRLSAYCVGIGFAVGRYGQQPQSGGDAAMAGALIGAGLALTLFWVRWFRRVDRSFPGAF